MARYLFSVHYTRQSVTGKTLDGTTIVSSERSNLGIPGAEKKLKAQFSHCTTVTVNRIEPYMSGADLVKERRRDRRF